MAKTLSISNSSLMTIYAVFVLINVTFKININRINSVVCFCCCERIAVELQRTQRSQQNFRFCKTWAQLVLVLLFAAQEPGRVCGGRELPEAARTTP